MYTPEKRIIRHGAADVKFRGPDMDYEGWNRIIDNFRKDHEKQYKETNDLYDLQRDQLKSLDSVLQGTSGKDYEYLQQSVVDARDKVKNLYKGKRLSDTKTPEFERQLYEITQGLANKKNSIGTVYDQIKLSKEYADNNPSIRKDAFHDFVNYQLSLPPDERDKDILNQVKTNPLFFAPYNHGTAAITKEGIADTELKNETDDLITNLGAEYRPSIGSYVPGTDKYKNPVFVFNPSDDFVSRTLNGSKHFYNAMAGMLPPEKSNELVNSGNTMAFQEAVHAQAKTYLKTIAEQQGLGPKTKPTSSKMKYVARATTYDKKLAAEGNEIRVVQSRLQDGDERAFDDLIGDFWRGFDFEVDNNGQVSGIIGNYEVEDQRAWKKGQMISKTEFVPVDPSDEGSVKIAINRIKSFANKEKKYTTPRPTTAPKPQKSAQVKKGSYKNIIDGKNYSHQDLLDKGYTEEQIQVAIDLGNLQ